MEKSTRPLTITWFALLVLLALSAATAWLPLGWMNTAIGMAVALLKALLVAMVFMRLRASHPLLRLTALAGVVVLALLLVLSGADYATRSEVAAPWQTPVTQPARLGSG